MVKNIAKMLKQKDSKDHDEKLEKLNYKVEEREREVITERHARSKYDEEIKLRKQILIQK